MKRSLSTLAFAGLCLLSTACQSTDSAATPVNTTCPVSGKAVDPSIPAAEFRGQMVGFCCEKCPPKWVSMSDSDRQAKLTAAMPTK